MKRHLQTGAVLAIAAALLFIFVHPLYREAEPSLRGTPASDFSLTLDGRPARLADLRGRVVVLNFWATWCQPCIEEAPSLNALQAWLAPRGGMVLGVNAGVQDDPSTYAKFLVANKIAFPAYFDSSARIALDYGTRMYPETYIIDQRGRIDRKIIGPQTWTSPVFLDYFRSLLARDRPRS